MMKYKAALFDLDGTLLDSLEDMADSINAMLLERNYPTRTMDEVRGFVGNGVKKLVERSLPDKCDEETICTCLQVFKNHYAEKMQNKTKPYEGILSVLSELKKHQIPTAIISNKYDEAVKELTREIFGQFIDVAVGTSAKIPPKPDTKGIEKALESLRVAKDKALYFGDSEVDIQTAQNAKMCCVGVTWGFRDQKVLEACGADYIITESREIMGFFI